MYCAPNTKSSVVVGLTFSLAFFCEIILTFILVFTIFCVVLNPHVTVSDVNNSTIAPLFAPIAVGFVSMYSSVVVLLFVDSVCQL